MRKVCSIILLIFIVSCGQFEGPAGPAGEDGVANIHTETFTISSSNTQASDGIGINQIDAPEITPAVVDSGVVKVELELSDGWMGLPWTTRSGTYSLELNYAYTEETISIIHINSSGSLYESQINEGPYKLTIIPPSERTDDIQSTSANAISGPNSISHSEIIDHLSTK